MILNRHKAHYLKTYKVDQDKIQIQLENYPLLMMRNLKKMREPC